MKRRVNANLHADRCLILKEMPEQNVKPLNQIIPKTSQKTLLRIVDIGAPAGAPISTIYKGGNVTEIQSRYINVYRECISNIKKYPLIVDLKEKLHKLDGIFNARRKHDQAVRKIAEKVINAAIA